MFVAVSFIAADDDYKQPREDEAVLAVRLIMDPVIDDAFFSQYWDIRSKAIRTKRKGSEEGEIVPSTSTMVIGDSVWNYKDLDLGNLGSLASVEIDIPKDRIVAMNGFYVYPSNLRIFRMIVPILANFTIPQGENYVYLGTFVCEWEGEQFDIVNIERIDEYDKAQQVIQQRYGSGARLVRVPMSMQELEKE